MLSNKLNWLKYFFFYIFFIEYLFQKMFFQRTQSEINYTTLATLIPNLIFFFFAEFCCFYFVILGRDLWHLVINYDVSKTMPKNKFQLVAHLRKICNLIFTGGKIECVVYPGKGGKKRCWGCQIKSFSLFLFWCG